MAPYYFLFTVMTSQPTLKKIPHLHYLRTIQSFINERTPLLTQYSINENILEQVSIIKDLDVLITNNLSWLRHIESIVLMANKTLGLVKRICRDMKNINTRRILYCTLLRPKLEYTSCMWSPYTIKHCMLVENVQRQATKFILNYLENMSYVDRLQKTNLLPLEYQREISNIVLLFKSKHHINSGYKRIFMHLPP